MVERLQHLRLDEDEDLHGGNSFITRFEGQIWVLRLISELS
jgi:hypothetical protein